MLSCTNRVPHLLNFSCSIVVSCKTNIWKSLRNCNFLYTNGESDIYYCIIIIIIIKRNKKERYTEDSVDQENSKTNMENYDHSYRVSTINFRNRKGWEMKGPTRMINSIYTLKFVSISWKWYSVRHGKIFHIYEWQQSTHTKSQ